MTDLHFVLDAITIIDGEGNISFKRYSEGLIKKINSKVVLINPQRRDCLHEIQFKDPRFVFGISEKPISFASLSKDFEYELKAICLSMVFLGKQRDFKKIKWSSMKRVFSHLKYLASILMKENLKSFRDLNKLKSLELQLIFKKFNHSIKSKKEHLAVLISILNNYRLITPQTYRVYETYQPKIRDNHKEENIKTNKSNSYPIIPDHVLLKTFEAIEKYKKEFEEKYKIWIRYFTDELENIKKGNYLVKNGEYLSKRDHGSIKGYSFIKSLNKFRKVVIFNTLLFTGMRKDEVKELKNTCTFEDTGTFYITSLLNKTVDHKLKLSWISSQSCNEMINLLIKLNNKVKERVQAILDTKDSRFNEEYITHLKSNLKDDKIFCFNYSLNTCSFDTLEYIKSKDLNSNFSVFKITLDRHDIDQLEFLECNYKSTQVMSKEYMVKYNINDYFNFSPHQFRHTFAYFMIVNNLCTIREIKHQFKHLRSSMTYIYSRRAIYTELINQSMTLDETIKIKSLMGFSESIAKQQSMGGGVKFILNALNLKDFKYNISIDPIEFKHIDQINSYLNKNKDFINFLPHGFCMNGSDCSLKSVADPLSCINCYGYITTQSNLPFWRGLLEDLNTKLAQINQLSVDLRNKYTNLSLNIEEKQRKISEIIDTLNGKKIDMTEIEVT